MRGLNLLRGSSVSKTAWKNHQYTEIACNIDRSQELRPLFPGSMLFNQILVPANRMNQFLPAVLPDTRDVEFEFCSQLQGDSQNTILLDIDDTVESPPSDIILKLMRSMSSVEQIVFLGKSTGRLIKGVLEENTTDISFNAVEPDWNSVYALHTMYRNARHILFVDTMRVLDAAFTGCNCTLIATDEFRRDIAFDFLLRQLDQTRCITYGSNGQLVLPEESGYKFNIAENNIHEVNRQLAANTCSLNVEDDWLAYTACEDVLPVIDVSENSRGSTWSNILDRKTRFLRKASKLRDDPGAFLADSDNKILNTAARVFPVSRNNG